jgi:hypothetical protein
MFKRNAAVILITGLVLGGGAMAYAAGAPQRPTVTAQQQTGARDRLARRPGVALMRRAVHGDLVVRDKQGQFVPVAFDRGTLVSHDGTTLTVKRPDGATVTSTLTDQTRFRGINSAAELRDGARTLVVSRDGKALVVAQKDAADGDPEAPATVD